MERPRLGEFLVAQGLLREEELARALELQRRSGERLGRILLALGYVRRKDLYRALSTLWGLPFVLLTEERPDPRLLRRWPLEEALRHRALPEAPERRHPARGRERAARRSAGSRSGKAL